MKELAEWTMRVLNIDPESENWIYDILLLVMIVFIATVCGIIMRRLILPLVKKLVRKTHVKWDDYIFSDGVIKAIGQLVPAIIAYFLTSLLFEIKDTIFHDLVWRVMNVYLIAVIIKFVCAVIESIDVLEQ